MISIKSPEQVQLMREAGALLHRVLSELKNHIKPGVSTMELDRMAEKMITDAGAIPSFKGYNGFPYTLCTSPDEQVVHGFPSDKPLKEGQLLSIDAGLVLNGWQADSAFSAPVGQVSDEISRLIRVTEECFWLAAAQAREGNRMGDISYAVQEHAEKNGYSVIRDLCGHGIGQQMHEPPDVPNFGHPGRGIRLSAGMTIAIEPMIAMGDWRVYVGSDGWTVSTKDHSTACHYEHTVAITQGEPEILTFPGANLGEAIR